MYDPNWPGERNPSIDQFRTATRAAVRQGLAMGKTICYQVAGTSMAPLIQPGDRIYVQPVELEEINPGDLLVLEEQDGWITHRFLSSNSQGGENLLLTIGDRLTEPDPPWLESALFGRAYLVERVGRRLALSSGMDRFLPYLLARLVIWRWRLLNKVSRHFIRRIIQRSFRTLIEVSAHLVWLTR